jgi:regulator of protease activity HflC (stomatin/prohibitin superfamily)
LVRSALLAAMREVLAGASINEVFTGRRQDYERRIEARVRQRLAKYESGIAVHAFHILDAHAPAEVHEAFRDVASAVEDRATAIHKARRRQARLIPEARANAATRLQREQGTQARVVARAHGQAAGFLELLGVYRAAPTITTQRLEYEMLDAVWPRVRKYIKPPASHVGDLEIWFVEEGTLRSLPSWSPSEKGN